MTLGNMRANGVRSLEGSRFLMLNPQPARGDNDTGRRKNRNERRPLP
jgi:hypothetical protein